MDSRILDSEMNDWYINFNLMGKVVRSPFVSAVVAAGEGVAVGVVLVVPERRSSEWRRRSWKEIETAVPLRSAQWQ